MKVSGVTSRNLFKVKQAIVCERDRNFVRFCSTGDVCCATISGRHAWYAEYCTPQSGSGCVLLTVHLRLPAALSDMQQVSDESNPQKGKKGKE